ncbi:hypothetical protein CJ179_49495 [Rhodococcus sp. ACS1]|nr:hypothetical protein CJ179_49495 [Rhodococcus sp. ACS1]
MGGEPSTSKCRHANGKRRDQPDTTDRPASVFDGIMGGERRMFACGFTAGGVPYGCFEDVSDDDAFDGVTADPFGWPGTRPRAGRCILSGPLDSTRSYMCALDRRHPHFECGGAESACRDPISVGPAGLCNRHDRSPLPVAASPARTGPTS